MVSRCSFPKLVNIGMSFQCCCGCTVATGFQCSVVAAQHFSKVKYFCSAFWASENESLRQYNIKTRLFVCIKTHLSKFPETAVSGIKKKKKSLNYIFLTKLKGFSFFFSLETLYLLWIKNVSKVGCCAEPTLNISPVKNARYSKAPRLQSALRRRQEGFALAKQ